MIKHSSFTEDEVEALVGEDDALKRFTSSYYNNLSKENTVDKVETTLTNNDDANDSVTFTVHKNNFQDKVIKRNIEKNKTTITATTLYVGSPILIDGFPDRWKGVYNGENILFTWPLLKHISSMHLTESSNDFFTFNNTIVIIITFASL